jgi:PAS domain S-box-containing protein
MVVAQDPKMLKENSREKQDAYVQEQTWSAVFEHLAVGVAQLTFDCRLLTANSCLCELLGLSKQELVEKNFKELFLPDGLWPECEAELDRLIAGGIRQYSINMSALRTDGKPVWVNVVFSPVRDSVTNSPRSLTAVAKDITSLMQATQSLQDAEVARDELSRRIMSAQDSDRTRIARELHDDIGQSLAVLKVQMLRSGKPVSNHPQLRHANLEELAANLEKVIYKVSRLSHDLHSSELELLGLAVAVKGHCRECSEKLGIPVYCSCDELHDKLNGMIGLAFLRVLQEALQNVLKHSRAKSITVALTTSDRELCLEISDDGVGFDLEGAKLAAGLGLISMRERIHLIGGQFEIWSSPGRGTRIRVRAPIERTKL